MNKYKSIQNIVFGSVIAVSVASFALSYKALRLTAIDYGFAGWRGAVYPLIVDIPVVVFGLSNLYLYLTTGKRNKPALFLTGAFTVLSIWLNILGAETLTAKIIHGLPPAALFASFEFFMMLLKKGEELADKRDKEAVNSAQAELKSIQAEVKLAQADVKNAQEQLNSTQLEIERAKAKVVDFRQQPKRTQAIYLRTKFPDMPKKDIASAVGVSAGMVTRYLAEVQ